MALLRSVLPAFLVSLLLLCCWCNPTDAAQALCDNGEGVYPCPSVSVSQTQWGVTWRNYTAIGIAGKGVFGPHGAIIESLLEGVPALLEYFNGTNAAKAVLERTIPIGVLMANAGNQTAYMTIFFLPDEYLKSPPGFINATGFLHLNTWPTATATFNPIVYSFLNRATNENIQSNLALLEAQLTAHKEPYYTGLTAYVSYSTPHDGLQQNEVWVFQTNPFPGHGLGHSGKRERKAGGMFRQFMQ